MSLGRVLQPGCDLGGTRRVVCRWPYVSIVEVQGQTQDSHDEVETENNKPVDAAIVGRSLLQPAISVESHSTSSSPNQGWSFLEKHWRENVRHMAIEPAP
jgi:hypothetical protein